MEKKFDLIGVGSPIVDSLALVSEDFIKTVGGEKGGMELIDAPTLTSILNKIDSKVTKAPGGSSANTIFGATRLGLSTSFLGMLGNDEMSQFYKNNYNAIGGDVSHFKYEDAPNGHCLSMITPDSQRTMRTNLGAALSLSPKHVNSEDFKESKHIHVEGYILFNKDLMYKILKSGKEAGCTISLDLASFEIVKSTKEILDDILPNYIDIVFANEDEAKAYTGIADDYSKMARELSKLCKIAVVKLGKDGAIVASEDTEVKVDAVYAEKVIDTTGAGDLWASGFLYGFLKNHGIEKSAKIGSLCGSQVVQIMGASIPDEKWVTIKETINEL